MNTFVLLANIWDLKNPNYAQNYCFLKLKSLIFEIKSCIRICLYISVFRIIKEVKNINKLRKCTPFTLQHHSFVTLKIFPKFSFIPSHFKVAKTFLLSRQTDADNIYFIKNVWKNKMFPYFSGMIKKKILRFFNQRYHYF